MLIEVRTDNNIEAGEKLIDHLKGVVQGALERFDGRIRRVDVHLSDAISNKKGHGDKCCMMEARLDGREPVAVTQQASTVEQAVRDAVHTLKRSIESALGHDSQRRDIH
jgi:Sigma 54 modulation protein / S30EA ribosomal protein